MDNTTMRHQYTICYENTHFVTQDVVCENIWLTVVIAKFIIDAHHRFTTGKIPTENLSVSPMHCEFMPRFLADHQKENQILFYQERITVRPLTASTCITKTVMPGNDKYLPLDAMQGKWGRYNLNHHRKIRNEQPMLI